MSDNTLKTIDAEHPWPGLMPFTEDSSAFFHGRDKEVSELFRLIKRETLTVLFGQSGLGKSSLLNAGVFPQLRQANYLPIYIRLELSEKAPNLIEQVFSAIKHNCEKHSVDVCLPDNDQTLWDYFHRRDTDFWSKKNQLLTPVLVFDQFEEIFTLGKHAESMENRCHTLMTELADLIEDRMPDSLAQRIEEDSDIGATLDYNKHSYKVVFSFREDYLPEFEELRTLIRPIMLNRMRITRMNGSAAQDAILQSGGKLVDDNVTEKIVRFVAAPRSRNTSNELERLEVEPALLSVVCHELNNQRLKTGKKHITADLIKSEAQQKIIQNYYISSFRNIDDRVRFFIEDQLLTDAGYRDSYSLDDALVIPGITREAIDLLITRRLLRLDERSGVLRVELTHDVLTSVASESRDLRRQAIEAEERRRQERINKRRNRKLIFIASAAFIGVISIAITFAVLLNDANNEREKSLQSQSYVMLSRANTALERNIPSEPYAMIAEAIRLYPENEAATSRAISLLEQRSNATLLEQVTLQTPAKISWHHRDNYMVHGKNALSLVTPKQSKTSRIIDIRSSHDDHADFGLISPWTSHQADIHNLNFTESITDQKNLATPAINYLYLPDSNLIAVTSAAQKLHLFDADSYKSVATPIQLNSSAQSIRISPDKQWVAIVTSMKTLIISKFNSSEKLTLPVEVKNASDLRIEFLSNTGNTLVCSKAQCSLFNVNNTLIETRLQLRNGQAALHPEGNEFSIINGNDILSYSIHTGLLINKFQHPATVRSISYSPDGNHLASACLDRHARLWNNETGKLAGPLLKHNGPVLVVRFGEDTNVLATGSTDGAVRIWQPFKGTLLVEPVVHADPIDDIRFQPHGDHLLTLTYGQQLNLWQWKNLSKANEQKTFFSTQGTAISTTLSGHYLAFSNEDNSRVITKLKTDDSSITYTTSVIPETTNTASSTLEFSPDNRHFALTDNDGNVHLYDNNTFKPVSTITTRHAVTRMKFNHSGKYLATLSDDRAIRLWDTEKSQRSGWPMLHKQRVRHLSFSHDDRLLLSAERNRIYLWQPNVSSHADVYTFKDESIKEISFDQDKSKVIIVLDKRIINIPILTNTKGQFTLSRNEQDYQQLDLRDFKLWTTKISDDASKIAIGGIYGNIRLIDADNLSFLGETMRHDDAVLGIHFSHDAKRIISWSRDRSLREWDTSSGYPISDPLKSDIEIEQAHFILDDKAVAISDRNSKVRIEILERIPNNEYPEWLPRLLENIGGGFLDKRGEMTRIRDRINHTSQLEHDIKTSSTAWQKWTTDILLNKNMINHLHSQDKQ